MKPIVILSVLLTIFALFFPILLFHNVPPDEASSSSQDLALTPSPDISPLLPEITAGTDAGVTVRLLTDGAVKELPLSEYLLGVLSAEMPASFAPEALKAQAVAARTYTMYKMLVEPSDNHPEADVCGDHNCCKAYAAETELREKWGDAYTENMERVAAAVAETDGICVLYEKQPALTVFHSSSAGHTESSETVWGGSKPYLISVETPETGETVPNYTYTVTVSYADFQETIHASYTEASFGEDPAAWIGNIQYTESGRIYTVMIGGVEVPGTVLRALFDLRSTTVDIIIGEGAITFNTTGYGHGVGMSQYGANTLADSGYTYVEILAHYYPGTELGSLNAG